MPQSLQVLATLAVWSLPAVIVSVHQGLSIKLLRTVVICLVDFPLTQMIIGFVQVMEQNL